MEKKEFCGNPRANSLDKIKCDCDMVFFGYKCKGKLNEYPLYAKKNVFFRLWLWEKQNESPIVTVDQGNHYCDFVPFKVAIDPKLFYDWAMKNLTGYAGFCYAREKELPDDEPLF